MFEVEGTFNDGTKVYDIGAWDAIVSIILDKTKACASSNVYLALRDFFKDSKRIGPIVVAAAGIRLTVRNV